MNEYSELSVRTGSQKFNNTDNIMPNCHTCFYMSQIKIKGQMQYSQVKVGLGSGAFGSYSAVGLGDFCSLCLKGLFINLNI